MDKFIKFPEIDLENIKGVLIDLDNTLYYYNYCHLKALQQCFLHIKKEYNFTTFEDFQSLYNAKRKIITQILSPQGACRSRLFAFQLIFEELKFKKNWSLALFYDELYWNALIDEMEIDEKALSFLKICKNSGIKVCVVTDMLANIQIKKLQKLKVEEYIDYIVTSEEVGAEKPNKIMFETALKKLDITAKEAIMIGDDEEKDIKGANSLGIKTYKVMLNK